MMHSGLQRLSRSASRSASTILVANRNQIDLDEIARWSKHEGKDGDFAKIKSRLVGVPSYTA